MSKNNSVLFVVLNYRGWQETLLCVEAVLKQDYPNFHLLLIENGSGDESPEKLAKYKKHKNITFVQHEVNLGFSGGVNVGIRHAIEHNYYYTVLLNNDAIIEDKWLSKLVKAQIKSKASTITGLLLDGDGKKIESTGDGYSYWGLPFPRQRDEDVSEAEESGFVFNGTAGASLYETKLFEEIGLFDESFFAYYEDTDIGFRAQISGHTAYYEKSALGYHDHGTTSSKIPGFTVRQTFQNLPLFFWKNVPLRLLLPIGLRFASVYTLLYIRAVLRGQFIVATKGVLRSLVRLPGALHKRIGIQRSRTVSIDYLKSVMYMALPPNNKRTVRRIFHL